MKKKITLVLLLIALCTALTAFFVVDSAAATQDIYTYTVTDGKATITDVSTTASGNITVPATLGGHSVTAIGTYAFDGCTSLTGVTLPSGIVSIGNYAFKNCTSITMISLPSTLESIGSYAFSGCSGLVEIPTMPVNVASIGVGAFLNCSSLEIVPFIDGSKLTAIPSRAFEGCKSLIGIYIPSAVTRIGDSAFENCTSFEEVSFSYESRLESIGSFAFAGTALKTLTIPASLKTIGQAAFFGCSKTIAAMTVLPGNNNFRLDGNSLIEIETNTLILGIYKSTIPSYVTKIASHAFYHCENLKSIMIPKSVTEISQHAFNGCTSLASVTFEEGSALTKLGNYAFQQCSSLLSFDIPNGVTRVSDNLFYECTNLTSVTVPEGVTQIAGYAFSYCSSLRAITIPSGVKELKYDPFSGCTSLTLVTVKSPEIAATLTSSTAGGNLVANAKTVVFPQSITEIGSYITGNFTYVDSTSQNGGALMIYSKHSHAEGAENWTTLPESQKCTICGVEKPLCTVHDLIVVGCTENPTCKKCGYVADPIGHDMLPATCLLPSTCSRCDHTEGEALGHDYGEWTDIKLPSYTENGIQVRICRRDISHSETTDTIHPDYITEWQAGEGVVAKLFAHPTVEEKFVLCFIGEGAMADYAEARTPWRSYAEKIRTLVFANGVTSIDSLAFEGFRGLRAVTICATVAEIEGNPFAGCLSLDTIEVATENAVYHSEGNCLIETATNKVVAGCKSSVIPAYVTTIGASAFEGSAVKDLAFSENSALTTIEPYAFAHCQSLAYAIIPANVTTIGVHAFSDCTAMYAVTLRRGSTLSDVATTAFSGCEALALVVVESADVAESISSEECFGGLFAYAETVSFSADVGTVSHYVKNVFTEKETLVSEGMEFTVYSKHSHGEGADVWEDTADGKICTDCGVKLPGVYVDGTGLVGDINGDGSITILDISALVKIASGQ